MLKSESKFIPARVMLKVDGEWLELNHVDEVDIEFKAEYQKPPPGDSFTISGVSQEITIWLTVNVPSGSYTLRKVEGYIGQNEMEVGAGEEPDQRISLV